MTLAEVGDVMNLSRERVRQIEEKAMKKVAEAVKAEGIEPSYVDPETNYDHVGDGNEDDS